MSRHKIALPDENRGWIIWSGRGGASEGRELSEIAGSEALISMARLYASEALPGPALSPEGEIEFGVPLWEWCSPRPS